MDAPSLWRAVVCRCAVCGELDDLDEDDLLDILVDGCHECGGDVELVEVDRMEDYLAAAEDLADGCALVAERQPSLRPRVEEALVEAIRRAERALTLRP